MALSGVTKWWWASPYNSPNHRVNWPTIYDPAWLAEQGVGLLLSPTFEWLQPGTLDDPPNDLMYHFDLAFEDAFVLCADYDIPVMLCLNELTYPYDPNITSWEQLFTTPWSYWENRYSDLFTAIEAKWGANGTDGHVLVGYWLENGTDNFFEWFRSFTDLEIRQGLYHNMWHVAGQYGAYIGNGDESMESAMARRMSKVDGVDIELWCYNDISPTYDLQGCAKYIRDNSPPDMSLGLNGAAHGGPLYDYTIPNPPESPQYVPNAPNPYPMAHGVYGVMMPLNVAGDDPPASFAVQTRRFMTAANIIKEAAGGAFDAISIQTGNGDEAITLFDKDVPDWFPRVKTDPTWWEFQQEDILFWESQNFMTPTDTVYLSNVAYEVS